MTLGAIIITAVALFVGLGALYVSWRFVRGLPTDRPGEPIEAQEAERAERARAEHERAKAAEAEGTENLPPRRTSASEWVAGAAIALGLVGLTLFMIRQLGSE